MAGIRGYHLGLPMISNPAWRGTLFTRKAKSSEFLRQYGCVFNAAEGNTTFYGLPSPATVTRWLDEVPATFRFCFKLPRSISHESTLTEPYVPDRVSEFLDRLAPLAERIGVLLLQLPPRFDGRQLPQLARFLAALPGPWHYAVEPRHVDYFGGACEESFRQLLVGLGMNRAMFDTTDLHGLEHRDESILEAQRKKPRVPRRAEATAQRPFIRYVGDNNPRHNLPSLRWLADQVASWIQEGRQPFVFMHAPDDALAPPLASAFHGLLRDKLGETVVGRMPVWPGENEEPQSRQLELF